MGSVILVTGSKAGLGLQITNVLKMNGHIVYDYDIKDGNDVRNPCMSAIPDNLDILINNAGINRIDWLENVTEEDFHFVMSTNVTGVFKMSQACLPALIQSKGTILNIVSNAAHMPMRCSLAYNASKGAIHIMTKQLARELTSRHGITVFGVAPNRLKGTEMSAYIDKRVIETRGWTLEEAREYQEASLPAGEETPPKRVAEFIGYLLNQKQNHKFLTGCILPYGI